jgi:hypothetical protein
MSHRARAFVRPDPAGDSAKACLDPVMIATRQINQANTAAASLRLERARRKREREFK